MKRGRLSPIEIESPHGPIRITSRFKKDKKTYRLLFYACPEALRWAFPSRDIPGGTGKVRLEISHPDRTITTMSNIKRFRDALAERLVERYELGIDPGGERADAERPTTLQEVIDRYFASHEHELQPSTAQSYRLNAKRALGHFGPHRPIARITADEVRKFMRNLSKKTTKSTANGAYRVLKLLLNYAVHEEWLDRNPTKKVKELRYERPEAEWWDEEEVQKVFAAATADQDQETAELFFAIALFLGLRRGEIDRLRWEDIRIDDGRPVVRIESTLDRPTKSGRRRFVPLNRSLLETLRRYRRDEGYVLKPHRKQWKGQYRFDVKKLFGRVVRAAGVRVIRIHDLRHTAATHMLQRGISIYKVSRWLGHAAVATTDSTYAHLAVYDPEVDLLDY